MTYNNTDKKYPLSEETFLCCPFSLVLLEWHFWKPQGNALTYKCLKMHGCIRCSVATDALALKPQNISTHSAD